MQNSKVHFWFIAPALLLMFILLILPVIVAATLSMTDYSLGNSSLIGLAQTIMRNYFRDEAMRKCLVPLSHMFS